MLKVVGMYVGERRGGASDEDVARKAHEIIVRRFGPPEIPPRCGCVAAVAVDYGQFEIADRATDAIDALKGRTADVIYAFRIGGRSLFRFVERSLV